MRDIYPDINTLKILSNPASLDVYYSMIPKDLWLADLPVKDIIKRHVKIFKKHERIVWLLRLLRLALAYHVSTERFERELDLYNKKAGYGFEIDSYASFSFQHGIENSKKIYNIDFKDRWGSYYNITEIGEMYNYYEQEEDPRLINKIKDLTFDYKEPEDIQDQLAYVIARYQRRLINDRDLDKRVVKNLHTFKNGWAWFYIGRNYCEQEAEAMDHCGEDDYLYSLRQPVMFASNKYWRPHVTIGADYRKTIRQIYGYNDQPVSPKYYKYVFAFLMSKYTQSIDNASLGGFNLGRLTERQLEIIAEKKPQLLDIFSAYKITGKIPSYDNTHNLAYQYRKFKKGLYYRIGIIDKEDLRFVHYLQVTKKDATTLSEKRRERRVRRKLINFFNILHRAMTQVSWDDHRHQGWSVRNGKLTEAFLRACGVPMNTSGPKTIYKLVAQLMPEDVPCDFQPEGCGEMYVYLPAYITQRLSRKDAWSKTKKTRTKGQIRIYAPVEAIFDIMIQNNCRSDFYLRVNETEVIVEALMRAFDPDAFNEECKKLGVINPWF